MSTRWPAQINSQRLWASMPAVLIRRQTTTQDSPFLPQRWPKPSPVLTAPIPTERWLGWVGLVNTGLVSTPAKGDHQSKH